MLINNKSLIKTINKLNLTDDEREKFNKISEDDRGNFLYNGKPIMGGATAEQANQIQANTDNIEDIINNKLDGHTFKFLTLEEYNALSDEEKSDLTIEYHVVDESDYLQTQNKTFSGSINELLILINDLETRVISLESGSTATIYTITNNLTNITNSNLTTNIAEGNSYSATLTADTGYEISSITIKMGDTDITSSSYSNGAINISSVNGNIVITAVATLSSTSGGGAEGDGLVVVTPYTLEGKLAKNNTSLDSSGAEISENKSYSTYNFITVNTNRFYVIENSNTSIIKVCGYDSSGTFVSREYNTSGSSIIFYTSTNIEKIKICCKVDSLDLFEETTITEYCYDKGFFTADGSINPVNSDIYTVNYLPIDSSSNYIITPVEGTTIKVCLYDENKQFIERKHTASDRTLTFNSGTATYMRYSVPYSSNSNLTGTTYSKVE